MNCENFEKIVVDLARGRLIEIQDRELGEQHADACGQCAAKLSRERRLTAGFGAVAAADHEKSANLRVEDALLEAFRTNRGADRDIPASQPNSFSPVLPGGSAPGRLLPGRLLPGRLLPSWLWPSWLWPSWSWPSWLWAAAAAILLIIGISIYRVWVSTPSQEIVGNPKPTPAQSPTLQPGKIDQIAFAKVFEEGDRFRKLKRSPSTHRPGRRPNNSRPQRYVIRDSMTLYASESEISTDFLPLIYSPDLPPMERGQLIRVKMPRSALLKFGLPMNLERANVPVNAELLVGEDGLAQAIRFVR